MSYGIKNEYDFVELFNNKYFRELDDKSRTFLNEHGYEKKRLIFPDSYSYKF